jgi:hypothetical protein
MDNVQKNAVTDLKNKANFSLPKIMFVASS